MVTGNPTQILPQMLVEFSRTGERRYSVTIFRTGYPTIIMDPAPGYDPIMPHDLAHLVVESEIGLRGGVYGQIAAGGNAGTFRNIVPAGQNQRETARLRRKGARRGAHHLRHNREDAEFSERAVHFCLEAWQAKAAGRPAPAVETPILDSKLLGRVCARLDEASRQWRSVAIGGSISIKWNDR